MNHMTLLAPSSPKGLLRARRCLVFSSLLAQLAVAGDDLLKRCKAVEEILL